ncbi:type II secretion system F family protein [Phenylobacterium sp.]|uniref:type II secretion system F family protein n=1 Tax=Phenylobacterium sp. TaxID=1871053 RepID=UPI0035B14B27
MNALLRRFDLEFHPLALVVAVIGGIALGFWGGAPLMGLIFGVGLFALVAQFIQARRAAQLSAERTHVRGLLEQATPLARSGVPLDQAISRAVAMDRFPGGVALDAALRANSAGRPDGPAQADLARWPLSQLVFQLYLVHRDNGGDPTRFLRAFRNALGMADDLAKKKQLALLQIRWQANMITLFFFIVLGFSVANAGVFYAALLGTEEGRSLTSISACLVTFGRVVLNYLARTME